MSNGSIAAVWTILLCVSITLHSQNASLSGHVKAFGDNAAVAGARLKLSNANASMMKGGFSNTRGGYELKNLSAGQYELTVSCIGYKSVSTKVNLAEGDNKVMDITLEENASRTEEVVISASRRTERALDAPASVSVISGEDIRDRPTGSAAEPLRGLAGVDIVQKGIAQNEIVVRGFSNVFSGSVLMLTDYRMASVPSLRANIPYFIPSNMDDIERIEVVRGPGSALFGPNVTQGVINILTRSPFASRGTTVSVTAGNMSLMNFNARHAGVLADKIGYKISAQYLTANDWPADTSEIKEERDALASVRVSGDGDTSLIGKRIKKHERYSADMRVDYTISDKSMLSLSSGLSQSVSTIEMTDLGAGQARDWRYIYANLQYTAGELFGQLTYNKSDAGSTYLLRTGNPIVDRSSLIVTKLQHGAMITDDWNLTYGADLFLTNPETDGTINGKNEGNDNLVEYGAYLQSNYALMKDQLNLLTTLRFDKHNQLADPFFSPRAALLYKLNSDNAVRVTVNRAFSTPSTNDLFLDLEAKKNILVDPSTGMPINPAWKIGVRALGAGTTGFTFDRDESGAPYYYSPMTPAGTRFSTADKSSVFNIARGIVQGGIQLQPSLDSNTKKLLIGVLNAAPMPTTVAAVMAVLNPTTAKFAPVTSVTDISRLLPTENLTFEVGYTGNLDRDITASVDVYYSHIKNFIGSQQVLSPNVFFASTGLDAYYTPFLQGAISGSLQQQGLPKSMADSIAAQQAPIAAAQIKAGFDQASQLPLGTVSPNEQTADRTAITLGPRNYGDVSMMGIDVSTEFRPMRTLAFRGSASVMSIFGDSAQNEQNYYRNLDNISDLALNAPKYRGSLSAHYRADDGYTVGAQARWNGGFFMNSGVYIGQINPYWLIDLNASYRVSFVSGMTVYLTVDNLLDNRVSQFIGAAPIGRLVSGRVSYSF